MLFGLKTVVWSIKNSASPVVGGGENNQIEMSLISDFFIYAIKALPIFATSLDQVGHAVSTITVRTMQKRLFSE